MLFGCLSSAEAAGAKTKITIENFDLSIYRADEYLRMGNSTNGNSTKTMNQKVHKAYMKQVKEDKKNFVYGDGKLKYLFIDLDGDTIDELITYPECNMPDQIIYTYSKGTVRQIDMLNYCRIDM